MSKFHLENLGWKAFQDLCGTIASTLMGQGNQVFSQGVDGGRDGAFAFSWSPSPGFTLTGNTVIQCKHFSSSEKRVTLSTVSEELEKIEALVSQGLCENYVLMSNGKLPAPSEAKIRDAVEAKGVKHCLIFGVEWIETRLLEDRKLRALVPRMYGLGDLSEIIDERAYSQASAVLESIHQELQTFVPTQSYRGAVEALSKHGVVFLLGEPAAGKSVIAATLALGSADQWQTRTIKADSASQFTQHWNPEEAAHQFFWIDDAFGATQFEDGLVSEWNAVLPRLKAAVKAGTRIVITSRDYIWQAARLRLKLQSWPELDISKVVVNVEDLSTAERQEILYNHIRLGAQTKDFKRRAKPYLEEVANNPRFLPEIARRLGDPLLTKSLVLTRSGVSSFVESPEDFLLGVVQSLDKASRAALTLMVMSSSPLRSPLDLDRDQLETLKMMDVTEAQVRAAFTSMNHSLVKLTTEDDGSRYWVPKHPTITDATTGYMRLQPEFLDIYIRMAKLERLLREIDCGQSRAGSVTVPPYLYPMVYERLAEGSGKAGLPGFIISFLASRVGDEFLGEFVEAQPRMIDYLSDLDAPLDSNDNVSVLLRAKNLNLVSEEQLDALIEKIVDVSVSKPDSAFETEAEIEQLLGEERLNLVRDAVDDQFDDAFMDVLWGWESGYVEGDDPEDYLAPLYEAVENLGPNPSRIGRIDEVRERLEEIHKEGEARNEYDFERYRDDARVSGVSSRRSIFEDVDA